MRNTFYVTALGGATYLPALISDFWLPETCDSLWHSAGAVLTDQFPLWAWGGLDSRVEAGLQGLAWSKDGWGQPISLPVRCYKNFGGPQACLWSPLQIWVC